MKLGNERQLVQLETRIAEVMSISDLNDHVLGLLEATLEASGTWLFRFGPEPNPVIVGGSRADAMAHYSADLFAVDPLQSYARALPADAFFSNQHNDFDADSYLRSAAYAEFYEPQAIKFVQGVYPTGLPYGTPRMFGIALCMRSLHEYNSMIPVLQQLEGPLRAAARRIARFEQIETERDLLKLVTADRGLCALWDEAANLVWLSPSAAAEIDTGALSTLGRAVAAAVRQCVGRERNLGARVLGRPLILHGSQGVAWEAELSSVRTPAQRVYVLGHLRCRRGSPGLALTRTEGRVLELIVQGRSNREAARELFVSEHTIKSHVSGIFSKLGVTSRAKAAAKARAMGLVSDDFG